MKFIFSLFTVAFLAMSCNTSKENMNANNVKAPNTKPTDQIKGTKEISNYYTTKSITYTTRSRLTFWYIDISEAYITYSTDPYLKETKTVVCNKDDWQAIKRLLREIDTKLLATLKAPTEKRLYDGAAHTTFSVREGDIVFVTPTFDEGEPPAQIKKLVNKVLSIKENRLKL
ncbi:hypothetical protein OAE03_00505 [Winogradskyella sp.]|nr:hypothetical protein [Winogradskyella sp.]MDC0009017.1 hypothetical protein [Winogradskyella sp.]MDC1504756.1 hypothetical protein [Winogradskyella sp.]